MANQDATPDPSKRWDGDERGTGVADASAIVSRVEALAEHASRGDWITEDATAHLWPHFERAIAFAGSPWRDASHAVDGEGRLVVELTHTSGAGERSRGQVRADAFALIGQIAEATTFVRVTDLDDDGAGSGDPSVVEVEVVTGMLDDETAFRTHGHTLRLRITSR